MKGSFIDPTSPNFLGGTNVQNTAIIIMSFIILYKVWKN